LGLGASEHCSADANSASAWAALMLWSSFIVAVRASMSLRFWSVTGVLA